MNSLRSSDLRHAVAALLVLVLSMAGVSRGLAAASDMAGGGFGIPGVEAHICHAGPRGDEAPADPIHHDCCDACALQAPAALAQALSLTGPALVVHVVAHARAMTWVAMLARPRSPRQSQGPPTA